MSLATVEQLAERLGVNLQDWTPEDAGRAQSLLDGASALVRSTAGPQQIDQATSTFVLDGNGATLMLLPELPVVAVSAVVLLRYGADGDDVELDEDDYAWNAAGHLARRGGRWPRGLANVEVTCTHGHDPVPDDVVEVVLSAAARAWQVPSGVGAEQTRPAGVWLAAGERRTIIDGYHPGVR